MKKKVNPKSIENLKKGSSGNLYDARKAKEAEKWNELMDVDAQLVELHRMGMRFLRGHRKFTKDQATVWGKMFEKLADKVLPTAKIQVDNNKTITIKVKKPNEHRDRPDGTEGSD